MGVLRPFVKILAAVVFLVAGCTQGGVPQTATGTKTEADVSQEPAGDNIQWLDPKGDEDGDTLLNGTETSLDTDPLSADTDNDGVNDGAEIAQGSDPLDPKSTQPTPNACDDLVIPASLGYFPPPCRPESWAKYDRDKDGVSDLTDNCLEVSNPDQKNSDQEIVTGLTNQMVGPSETYKDVKSYDASAAYRVATAMLPDELGDACDQDDDGDGIKDVQEQKTDPLNPDTDGDGILDGTEDLNSNGIVDPGETDPTVVN